MAEKFLTSVQASQLLGINPDTMRRYLREGKVRALRLGRDWKIPESSLSDLARGGRLAKGGKPIAPEDVSKPTQNEREEKMREFLRLAQELDAELEAAGYQGVSGEELIRQSREERDKAISGL